MQLLPFLEQSDRDRQMGGAQVRGAIRPMVSVGPCDIAEWSAKNKADVLGGAQASDWLLAMYKSFTQAHAGGSKDFRLKLALTGAASQPFSDPAALAEALWHCDASEPELAWLDDARKAARAIVGFGVNMQQWPWPACRHYHTISPSEAQLGCSNDFATKHLNTNASIKGAKKVAELRGKAVVARQGITAFGSIVTSRSGGITKEDGDRFLKEILGRQKEFSDTHRQLCEHFQTQYGRYGGVAKAKFQSIDSVTFVTLNKYAMHEFEDGQGGETDLYVRFSVSCDATGAKWAVHHLDSTSHARTHRTGTLLSAQGLQGIDATTSAKFAD